MSEQSQASGPTEPGPAPSVRTGASLWMIGAFLRAFVNWPIDFYPRLARPDMQSLKADAIVGDMVRAMQTWTVSPSDPNLDKAIELAKASLQEVKAQTEYQDQKAARLLTVSTFLTALAGALFASFGSAYPLRYVANVEGLWGWVLVGAYLSFLFFILSSLAGALVTFHATRTRFKYPAEATAERQQGPTRSFLFFREIIGVSPAGWAGSFCKNGVEAGQELAHLRLGYLRNYVAETYLVAAKAADKLRYMQPGQSLLAWALRFLIVFLCLLATIQICVPATPATPTKVTLVPAAPAPQ
jgi:hypothetical protein